MTLDHDFFKKSIKQLSINCTILGFDSDSLKVLTLKFKNSKYKGLSVGSIFHDEDLDFAAHRTLKELTGLKNVYLDQVHTFGKVSRVNREETKKILKKLELNFDDKHPLFERIITVGYVALVNIDKVEIQINNIIDDFEWVNVNEVPKLINDHNEILITALEHLRKNIYTTPLIQHLMPASFTMKELQSLYEIILQEKLVRTNFQRWMLKQNILERLEKLYTGKAHKAPYQYKFKK